MYDIPFYSGAYLSSGKGLIEHPFEPVTVRADIANAGHPSRSAIIIL